MHDGLDVDLVPRLGTTIWAGDMMVIPQLHGRGDMRLPIRGDDCHIARGMDKVRCGGHFVVKLLPAARACEVGYWHVQVQVRLRAISILAVVSTRLTRDRAIVLEASS